MTECPKCGSVRCAGWEAGREHCVECNHTFSQVPVQVPRPVWDEMVGALRPFGNTGTHMRESRAQFSEDEIARGLLNDWMSSMAHTVQLDCYIDASAALAKAKEVAT